MIRHALCVSLFLASATSAQSVLVVDGASGAGFDFKGIQEAVDAAIDGDVLLIRPGTYGAATINGKSLVLQGDGPGVTMLGPLRAWNLPAQGQMTLRGIDIQGYEIGVSGNSASLLSIMNCAGPVWVEEVRVNALPNPGVFPQKRGTEVSNCVSAVFVRCELRAAGNDVLLFGYGNPGLTTSDSNVSLYDCTVRAGVEVSFAIPKNVAGSSGIEVSGGTLFLSGCDVVGGDGADGVNSGLCLQCQGGDAGPGMLLIDGNPSVGVLESTIAAGSVGAGTMCGVPAVSCGSGSVVADTIVQSGTVTRLVGAARRMVINSPVREGEVVSETWTGEPGDLILHVFSFNHIEQYSIPGIVGSNLIGQPFFWVFQGSIGPSGSETVNFAIASGVPSSSALTFYNQSLFIDPSLNLTTGGPTVLVLLDKSL